MELILKALKEAQAVLTDYLTPKPRVRPSTDYQNTFARANEAEETINKLLGILDHRDLVQQQRECERINGGDNIYTSAVRLLGLLGYEYRDSEHNWFATPQAQAVPIYPNGEGSYFQPVPARPFVAASQMASADPNVEAVRKMLLDRSALGFKKYGIGTNRKDLQLADWLQHMQEELCDAVVYIEAAKAGANPHAEELAEAKTELGRVAAYQKGLQSRITDLVSQSAGHREQAKQLQRENTELRATLARITDAMKGEKF